MTSIVRAIKEAVKPGDGSEQDEQAASPTGSGQAESRPYKPSYGFFDGAGAGCEVAGGLEAGCVLDCGVDGVDAGAAGVVAGAVAGAAGVVEGVVAGAAGVFAGLVAGCETRSRIELPWPTTALSVRRTMAKAHNMNMTAHQVVALESTLAAPREPKAVWLPAPPKAPARSAALPLWSSTTMISTRQFKMKNVGNNQKNQRESASFHPPTIIPAPINSATSHFIQPGILKTSLNI